MNVFFLYTGFLSRAIIFLINSLLGGNKNHGPRRTAVYPNLHYSIIGRIKRGICIYRYRIAVHVPGPPYARATQAVEERTPARPVHR